MEGAFLGFLGKLAIGSGMITLNLGIQVWSVYRVIVYFKRKESVLDSESVAQSDITVLTIIMGFLFIGHILQFSTWAILFMGLGEFSDFGTAFYHSTVNFTSLGYGDIVMSETWRLLGALEAANGVLMFGLTAGLVLSVMNELFSRHEALGTFMHTRSGKSED